MPINASDQEAEELRKVIVSGVQSVESDGRKVVYRTLNDLQRVSDLADRAKTGKSRMRKLTFSRGY